MSAGITYGASPIKRPRRTRAAMGEIREALYRIVVADQPMTVRQVFYRAVAPGIVEKTEAEYQRTVGRLLAEMRHAGVISWHWITDFTRTQRRPRTFGGLQEALADTAASYRRALWRDTGKRVEVWCEKDALAGVLLDVTWDFDVPLMVTRGYPSLSFLHAAGQEIAENNAATTIYYFGDHDPSGIDISVKVEAGLRKFAPGAEIFFERVAVLPWQIAAWGLPTRPTKRTDTRSRSFEGASVELDAIPPQELRGLCRNCITRHLPAGHLEVLEAAEASERELLKLWAAALTGDAA